MRHATLCFLVEPNHVWLGVKKRKFGKGKYNGFGGKQKSGETIEEAAVRELFEESGVEAVEYEKVSEITYIFPDAPQNNQVAHGFLVHRWQGMPKETDEMTAERFPKDGIPYDKMWDNDKYWLPLVLEGKKVKGCVVHDGKSTLDKDIKLVDGF